MKQLRHIRNILAARPDTEHIQVYIRALWFFFVALPYTLIIHRYGNQTGGWDLAAQLWVCSFGLLIGSAGWIIWILLYPGVNHLRRLLGIVHDTTWTGVGLYALGDSGLIMFSMYIWIVIGNGFRFGSRYLYAAAALALLSFWILTYFSPYYRSNLDLLALGTFLLAVVIPLYLGTLLKQLQRNLDAAREADRLKTRFLANVSHDLRTPLNVVLANCDVLSREGACEGHQLRQVRDMQEAATTLNGLLVDLLDVAKIEAGRLKIVPASFNVLELLGRVMRFNQVAAKKHGTQVYLTVDPSTPAHIIGDKLRLEQVLSNLVSNAVKYTEQGEVHIQATADIDVETAACNSIAFSISDTGIGMEPEAIDRIFSRFEQADDSYARRYAGAGLGLSIAKELINLMAGTISVESTKGAGSCFTVCVPLKADEKRDPEPALKSLGSPVMVICNGNTRRQYWEHRFDGDRLPKAVILTVADFAAGKHGLPGSPDSPIYALVDAQELDINPADAPELFGRSSETSRHVWILVNTPTERPVDLESQAPYKRFRSIVRSPEPADIRKALDVAYWTTRFEQSATESDNDLDLWMHQVQGLAVLIADDNALNRRVIADMLGYVQAHILQARDGTEALALLNREPVDIALLDIQMPGLTGVEVMHAHREHNPGTPVTFIALTADTTDECRTECFGAGAVSVLYKPVALKSLYHELYLAVTARTASLHPLQQLPPVACANGMLDHDLLRELEACGQSPDYLASLVACFEHEGSELLQELGRALEVKNATRIRTLLHKLKGMSSSIGARAMATMCGDTLSSSDEQLTDSGQALIDKLWSLYRDSNHQLNRLISGKLMAAS